MRLHHLLAAASFMLCNAAAAQSMSFEPYYPNRAEQTLVFDYTTSAEGAQQQTYSGTLTRSPAAPESRGGVTYQTVRHTTSGLPDYYPRRWKSYHRETAEGLYSGQLDDNGRLEQHLEFPASAEPGEEWNISSEFWDSQAFYLVPRAETEAGTFENCIRVERLREDAASGQTLTNTTTYCPGVSAVHSTVEHIAPEFRSVTEMRLKEIRR
jgi:hypothetical protein